MVCCVPIIKNFVNETITLIPYGDYERSLYGTVPEVALVYSIDGEWVHGGVFTEVKYFNDYIRIDHGGESTGYAKIS